MSCFNTQYSNIQHSVLKPVGREFGSPRSKGTNKLNYRRTWQTRLLSLVLGEANLCSLLSSSSLQSPPRIPWLNSKTERPDRSYKSYPNSRVPVPSPIRHFWPIGSMSGLCQRILESSIMRWNAASIIAQSCSWHEKVSSVSRLEAIRGMQGQARDILYRGGQGLVVQPHDPELDQLPVGT